MPLTKLLDQLNSYRIFMALFIIAIYFFMIATMMFVVVGWLSLFLQNLKSFLTCNSFIFFMIASFNF